RPWAGTAIITKGAFVDGVGKGIWCRAELGTDTIGPSTQDYLMRSPQPCRSPLLMLTVVAVAGLLLHWEAEAMTPPDNPPHV
ncbi:MAG TPA: hypothetical protein VE476_02420, partial [Propionibacteriaceae bacterium]|nr:hypothetical protein [Propionibacteriaceae bacterium]